MKINQFENNVVSFLKEQNCKFTLGLSGGVDSIVLLHILATHNINFNAIYVHHGLSENANAWEQFCQSICEQYNIDLTCKHVQVDKGSRQSLENEARILRYNAYKEMADLHNTKIILGHHHDDLVESMLMNLLNRSGLKGLSTMPNNYFNEEFGITILRPFLANEDYIVEKSAIEEYAGSNNLHHITDESNFDESFSRNFLRNDIIPKLKSHFGNIAKPMARTNKEAQEKELNSQVLNCFLKRGKNFYTIKKDVINSGKTHCIAEILKSFKVNFNTAVSRGVAETIFKELNKESINPTFKIVYKNLCVFSHENNLYVTYRHYLSNFETGDGNFYTKQEISNNFPTISLRKAFKKRNGLKTRIPSIFKEEEPIYKVENNELVGIYKRNPKDYSPVDIYNPILDYFF